MVEITAAVPRALGTRHATATPDRPSPSRPSADRPSSTTLTRRRDTGSPHTHDSNTMGLYDPILWRRGMKFPWKIEKRQKAIAKTRRHRKELQRIVNGQKRHNPDRPRAPLDPTGFSSPPCMECLNLSFILLERKLEEYELGSNAINVGDRKPGRYVHAPCPKPRVRTESTASPEPTAHTEPTAHPESATHPATPHPGSTPVFAHPPESTQALCLYYKAMWDKQDMFEVQ